MKFKVIRNSVTLFESTTNFCDKKKPTSVDKLVFTQFAVPSQCSFDSATTFCYKNRNLTFASSQKLLSTIAIAASSCVVRVEVIHDIGRSCFEVDVELSKI